MEFLHRLFSAIIHAGDPAIGLQAFVKWIAASPYFYLAVFGIIFCETGFVVTPFLPGDSLLFTIGVIAGEANLSLPIVMGLLVTAALAGDNVNYWIGRRVGPKVFSGEKSRLLNKKHLLEAQAFYEKYGRKTIILARFVPIVRTFAPFVAGIGKMRYAQFLLFSVIGAVAWVSVCTLAGVFFGKVEFVQKHFELVIVAIVLISVLPVVYSWLMARRKGHPQITQISQMEKE